MNLIIPTGPNSQVFGDESMIPAGAETCCYLTRWNWDQDKDGVHDRGVWKQLLTRYYDGQPYVLIDAETPYWDDPRVLFDLVLLARRKLGKGVKIGLYGLPRVYADPDNSVPFPMSMLAGHVNFLSPVLYTFSNAWRAGYYPWVNLEAAHETKARGLDVPIIGHVNHHPRDHATQWILPGDWYSLLETAKAEGIDGFLWWSDDGGPRAEGFDDARLAPYRDIIAEVCEL